MLVDDSEDFLRAASALLGSEGVAIVGQASSCSRALQLAAVTEPDVILVDVELGLEDGFEVARHLHRAHPPSKVVLISLRDQDEERIEETGAIGFLRKDVLDRLAIQHLLDSSKSPRSSRRHTPSLVHPSARHALMFQKEVALRRVATMVAHQVAVSEIVEAVSDELTQILGLSVTVVIEPPGSTDPSGTDTTTQLTASGAGRTRVVVDAEVWGSIVVEPKANTLSSPDIQLAELLDEFASLIAKAVANERHETESRELVQQQSALRDIATLVAQNAGPETIFEAIVEGASQLLGGISFIRLFRFDMSTGILTDVSRHTPDEIRNHVGAGAQFKTDESPLAGLIVRTGQPARIEDWSTVPGELAERHLQDGFGPAMGVPITVDGVIWGAITAYNMHDGTLPMGSESRLVEFSQLMATAISNVQARDNLRDLAEWQGALGRVATHVAVGDEPESVFTAVAYEAARILRVGAVALLRYDAEANVLVKLFGTHGGRSPVPDGTSFGLEDAPLEAKVVETNEAARLDDWSDLPGPVAAGHIANGFGQGVAAPVIINNSIWGFISAFGEADEVLPLGSEVRLAEFTRLMASAISNAEARSALRSLAEKQGAALRRVATLVAQQASPGVIFAAVAHEASRALGVQIVEVIRRADGSLLLLGSTARDDLNGPLSDGEVLVARKIKETGQAERIVNRSVAEFNQDEPFHSTTTVGAPILVDGEHWGVIVVTSAEDLPHDTETRLTDFTHLVAGSISNVQARDNLLASRARIVSASDETRRRIERNLHDGIQQKLVSLGMNLRTVRRRYAMSSEVEEGLDELARDLENVVEEIRLFSQGLHPDMLTRSGLGPSIRSLARRSAIPVEVDAPDRVRYLETVEIAIYFAVSEGLANATKHSHASVVSIRITFDGSDVRATVSDDGIGGASLSGGSGLIGIIDRVEALGGRVTLDSPANVGTTITVTLPSSVCGLVNSEDV
jgi:signal transduction histidine kinase/DNA-binding NarL/FixJ family response regulator